jgi:superfamily II DNA or RNA helicase
MHPGEWVWHSANNEPVLVVEVESLWGEDYCRTWSPSVDQISRIPAVELLPMDSAPEEKPAYFSYAAAATCIADALSRDVIAPIGTSVIQLPHQLWALERATSGERRHLLADEVGLGKTIEAGLIMRELKFRGLVERTLVVAPRGIVTQWVSEMRTHFNEEFRLLEPSEFSAYRRVVSDENVWRSHDQVVCSIDSVKPIEARRGWSQEQLERYNQERFEDLVSAGWDLIIVDEAHRLGGSTEQIARYKLGRGLSEASPFLLLLTATPHQGKSESFYRVMSLLDPVAFPDVSSVTRERIAPYVVRTEKRKAIDARGNPLFKPRTTRLEPISWEDRHRRQKQLYEAVTDYVREGYNQAMREKKSYIGFLMILMQRLVTSSTSAIRATLERRLDVLESPDDQLTLFPELTEEEWNELDGEEQVETFLGSRLKALKNERREVELLLEASRLTEAEGPDPKTESLLSLVYRMQQEETDPNIKVLVFTEFVGTQAMLKQFLEERGFAVVCLNGSMGLEERIEAQARFAGDAQVMVSTDAGGEGLNLQFCHVVVNYDIPWNPMKLEQRIGRVDRIGQEHPVRVFNFVLIGTVEHRVREVLEEKLRIILNEFGVDKMGDVLDSAQADKMFDELYIEAIVDPTDIDRKAETLASKVREQAEAGREASRILEATNELDPAEAMRLSEQPISFWLERMVTCYIAARDGTVKQEGPIFELVWPDGLIQENVVFEPRDSAATGARMLTLEEARVRNLVERLPRMVAGQTLHHVVLPELPEGVSGLMSVWEIALTRGLESRRMLPLFIHDDGRVLAPTANNVWERLIAGTCEIIGTLSVEESHSLIAKAQEEAEKAGRGLLDELLLESDRKTKREREKMEYSFATRRKAIERVGIPQVKKHRLAELEREERQWRETTEHLTPAAPELSPVFIIKVSREVNA